MIIRAGRVNFLISFKAKEQRTIVHSVFFSRSSHSEVGGDEKKESRG